MRVGGRGTEALGVVSTAPQRGKTAAMSAQPLEPLHLATGTSPLRRLSTFDTEFCELWMKDDGALSPIYGGNKVRKLEWILAAARARGATRLLTGGAAGSHHVLATALFGKRLGFRTAAALCPQPATPHVRETLMRSLEVLDDVYPCRYRAELPGALLVHRRRGDELIAIGGSSVLGSRGYDTAVDEFVSQLAAASLPCPDVIVVAVGSGGTAAGILAGLIRHRLPTKLCAVQVLRGRLIALLSVGALSLGLLRGRSVRWNPLEIPSRLSVSRGQVGAGYGRATEASREAIARGATAGIPLDPTYTAKTFAEALAIGARSRPGSTYCPDRPWTAPADRPLRVLYWHTLSSVPFEPSVAEASRHAAMAANLLVG